MKTQHQQMLSDTDTEKFWFKKEHVERFCAKAKTREQDMVTGQIQDLDLNSSLRILDIGAGPGLLAIPLAKMGHDVTVVEQSPLMCEAIREKLVIEGIENLRIITSRWEDLVVEDIGGPYDRVIASFSLTMPDISEAVSKMIAVCRGKIYLYWFLTPPSWMEVIKDLWPAIHQETYYPPPLADCLWNVLYEMGIHASLDVRPASPMQRYGSLDDLIREYTGRLNCNDEWQREIVKTYLEDRLLMNENGIFFGGGTKSAKIWWDQSKEV